MSHHHEHRREEEEERHDKHHHKHHGEEHNYEERREERYEGYGEERRGEGYGGEGYGRRPGGYEQEGYGGYGGGGYGGEYGGPVTVQSTEVSQAQVRLDGIQQARVHETTYKRTEYAGVAGAALGAGLAMYESHEAKIDPQNAARHKLEAEIAGGLGVGSAGVGFYGHHQRENAEQTREELETGHKKHSWF